MQDILLVAHHHFDPTWRRCFDRDATYNGVLVRSYAEIEEHCINAWLALSDRGYAFSDGQTSVWRKYLERNPEKRDALRLLAGDGRLAVMLAGEVVPDTTLSTAEGLVRNFLVARPFYRDFVGEDHPALNLAWLEDAFGNSPNYPQVLTGVGAEVACMLSYRKLPPTEHVWVGLDGTKIACYDNHPQVFQGSFAKHAPCAYCRGAGCDHCEHTGLNFVDGFDLPALRQAIHDGMVKHADSPWFHLFLLTEEVRPDARVAALVEELNVELAGKARIRFATPLDLWERHAATCRAAVAAHDATPSVDLNPAMPGCMVSRIRCKQRTRALTYHLVAAEAALANAAWVDGRTTVPPADLAEAWKLIAFNQFHDAITGTHIDAAHRELLDMLDRVEVIAKRHQPLPRRKSEVGELAPVTTPTATLRLGVLEVTVDRHGILSILRDGEDVFGQFPAPSNNRQRRQRIGELMLEPDFGDAWGKRLPDPVPGTFGTSTINLGDYHYSVSVSDRAVRWHGEYDGGDKMVKKLAWVVTLKASADRQRLEFRTEVNWDTGSRRLRVVFPVKASDASATYEVPFGWCERAFDAKKADFTLWTANQLEYPTLHWMRKQVDAQRGVVLFNKGLPCNRWQPGWMDLSLLRSPEYQFCVVEPGSYEFWDIDGMRDAGKHVFEYALFPYTKGVREGDLVRTGYAYNAPLPTALPFRLGGDVVITAWKLAEDGAGWILRVQEAGGTGTTVALEFAEPRTVTLTNLLEDPQAPTATGPAHSFALRAHGILTLRIR